LLASPRQQTRCLSHVSWASLSLNPLTWRARSARPSSPAPYEATIEAAAGCVGLLLRNITVRHSSPSVANNYAVFATAGSGVSLEGCDVSSETGSGVVGEGAQIRVSGCRVHGCKTHGVAIYGDLLGEFGGGTVAGHDTSALPVLLKCPTYRGIRAFRGAHGFNEAWVCYSSK
jgi:hypothetical protein